MKILVTFLYIFIFLTLVSSEGMNFKELQRILADSNESPFVNLLLIYDSATESNQLNYLAGPAIEMAMKKMT
jgi:hypothetical protein